MRGVPGSSLFATTPFPCLRAIASKSDRPVPILGENLGNLIGVCEWDEKDFLTVNVRGPDRRTKDFEGHEFNLPVVRLNGCKDRRVEMEEGPCAKTQPLLTKPYATKVQ